MFTVFRGADGLRVFKVGQVHELRLDVMVENLGEDAHETTLTVNLPEEVSYIGVETSPRQVRCPSRGRPVGEGVSRLTRQSQL